jgi:hypothetical protein
MVFDFFYSSLQKGNTEPLFVIYKQPPNYDSTLFFILKELVEKPFIFLKKN